MAHAPVYLWWSEQSSQKWVLLHLPRSPGLHTQIIGFGTGILLSSATGSLATVEFAETGSHAVLVPPPKADMTGVYHHSVFMQCWGSNMEPHVC